MLFFIWNFFICMTFHACKYCILFQFIHAIWFVWRNVGCWECGMLGKGHIEHVGFWGCVDVGDVEFGGFRMFRRWDVRNVECMGYGMFGIWDVGCGMLIYKIPTWLTYWSIFSLKICLNQPQEKTRRNFKSI